MPLRKSPTLNPVLLASNRPNTQKSTGPRTARGKAWSQVNHLRGGWCSPKFVVALIDAPSRRVGVTAQALLNCQAVDRKSFGEAAGWAVQAEIDICEERRWSGAHRA